MYWTNEINGYLPYELWCFVAWNNKTINANCIPYGFRGSIKRNPITREWMKQTAIYNMDFEML